MLDRNGKKPIFFLADFSLKLNIRIHQMQITWFCLVDIQNKMCQRVTTRYERESRPQKNTQLTETQNLLSTITDIENKLTQQCRSMGSKKCMATTTQTPSSKHFFSRVIEKDNFETANVWMLSLEWKNCPWISFSFSLWGNKLSSTWKWQIFCN